jgi:hypothetical protein
MIDVGKFVFMDLRKTKECLPQRLSSAATRLSATPDPLRYQLYVPKVGICIEVIEMASSGPWVCTHSTKGVDYSSN